MSGTLRDQFVRAFGEAIADTALPVLQAAWASQAARTGFYEEILRSIGDRLGLSLEKELLIVDFALIGQEDRVPRIFIESENIATSAAQEVRKLCCLSAPLKILLAVCEWDETPGVWPSGSLRPQLVTAWRAEVKRHERSGTLVGDVIAVVAEWRPDHTLRFYSLDLRSADIPDFTLVHRATGEVGV